MPHTSTRMRLLLIIISSIPLLTITSYAILEAVNSYLDSLVIFAYEGYNAKITYKSPLLPLTMGNDTKLVLEILDERGVPVKGFIATIVAPRAEGGFMDEYVAVKGSRVSKSIGYMVSEARRLVLAGGGRPDTDGPSITLLISAIVEGNGGIYIAPDIALVPIIPGKAVGKEVIVSVKLKPIARYEPRSGGGGKTQHVGLQQEPPKTIEDYCLDEFFKDKCYYWKYNTTIQSFYYETVPLMITYLDSYDGDYITNVRHKALLNIETTLTTYVGFTLGFGLEFKIKDSFKAEIAWPGVGFTFTTRAGESKRILLDLYCVHVNGKLSSSSSSCKWYDGGQYRSSSAPNFYDEALISLEIWAYRYDYIHYLYVYGYYEGGPEGVMWWVEEVIGHTIAPYIVPLQRSDGSLIHYVGVDDNPYDGAGYLEENFKTIRDLYYQTSWIKRVSSHVSNTQYTELSYNAIFTYIDETSYVVASLQTSWLGKKVLEKLPSSVRNLPTLPKLVPVVGFSVDVGKTTQVTSLFLAQFIADSIKVGSWGNILYYFDKYIPMRVKLEGDQYRDVPILLYWPFFTAS